LVIVIPLSHTWTTSCGVMVKGPLPTTLFAMTNPANTVEFSSQLAPV
jgi:hypothetical protein